MALLAVYGYMLTELGLYGIYQPPKSTTRGEMFFFLVTVLVVLGLSARMVTFSVAPFSPHLLRLVAFHFAQRAR